MHKILFRFQRGYELKCRQRDQKSAEDPAQGVAARFFGGETAENGEKQRGHDDEDRLFPLHESVFEMDDEGDDRHRQKGDDVGRLRDVLADAEKDCKNGYEHRSAAHAHSAEHTRNKAREKI